MYSPFSLKGKRAVVAGGLGKIGVATVTALAQAGSKVIVGDVNDPAGKRLAKRLKKDGHAIYYEHFNVAELKKIPRKISALEKKYGPADIWINNAYPRTADWLNRLEKVTIDSWRKNVDMHLNSYCICSNEIAKRMAKRKKGVIVNVASIQGVVAPDFSVYEGTDYTSPAAYTAIKGGILMYSRYLASYYGKNNIRVNVICPGGYYNKQDKKFIRKYSSNTLLKRMAYCDEIAHPIVFLASHAASYITGAVLMVDGGLTAI